MTIHPFVAGLGVLALGLAWCLSHYAAAEEEADKEWRVRARRITLVLEAEQKRTAR